MTLSDKQVVIVTGSASGIGKAIALAFAKDNYRVFLFDKDQKKLDETIKNEFSSYITAYYIGDVSKKKDVEKAVSKCLAEFGRIDVLVSNVGIIEKISFFDIKEEDWDKTLSINAKGMFFWGQAVSKWMMDNHVKGSIINISCMRAKLMTKDLLLYATSKGAVSAMTKAMAIELGPYGIRVNAIAPGRTYTEATSKYFEDLERKKKLETLIPLGHIALPDEIAQVALFLASKKAIYTTGAVIPVDGGYICSKD